MAPDLFLELKFFVPTDSVKVADSRKTKLMCIALTGYN